MREFGTPLGSLEEFWDTHLVGRGPLQGVWNPWGVWDPFWGGGSPTARGGTPIDLFQDPTTDIGVCGEFQGWVFKVFKPPPQFFLCILFPNAGLAPSSAFVAPPGPAVAPSPAKLQAAAALAEVANGIESTPVVSGDHLGGVLKSQNSTPNHPEILPQITLKFLPKSSRNPPKILPQITLKYFPK